MVEVCETMSTFKASNRFAEFHAIYINGEFSFNATHAYLVVLSDVHGGTLPNCKLHAVASTICLQILCTDGIGEWMLAEGLC